MKIVTVKQHSSWYQKSRKMPYLTTYIKPSPSLAKGICQIRDTLKIADSRQLYSPYSYLHITVKELGYLGEAVRQEQLPAILSVVRDVASNHEPFDLEVDGIGIFPSVIYGRVGRGATEVRKINEELAEKLEGRVIRGEYDGEKMMPHITIVHFTTRDVEPLLEQAKKLAARFVGRMRVNEVQVRKSYPYRLVERPLRRIAINEPLASFKLKNSERNS